MIYLIDAMLLTYEGYSNVVSLCSFSSSVSSHFGLLGQAEKSVLTFWSNCLSYGFQYWMYVWSSKIFGVLYILPWYQCLFVCFPCASSWVAELSKLTEIGVKYEHVTPYRRRQRLNALIAYHIDWVWLIGIDLVCCYLFTFSPVEHAYLRQRCMCCWRTLRA